MNWVKLSLQLLPLILNAVMGVEKLAKDKDSTTKQKMAHDAVVLGSGVAAGIDPNDAATIQQVSSLVNATIDSTVATYNALGVFKPKVPAPLQP